MRPIGTLTNSTHGLEVVTQAGKYVRMYTAVSTSHEVALCDLLYQLLREKRRDFPIKCSMFFSYPKTTRNLGSVGDFIFEIKQLRTEVERSLQEITWRDAIATKAWDEVVDKTIIACIAIRKYRM